MRYINTQVALLESSHMNEQNRTGMSMQVAKPALATSVADSIRMHAMLASDLKTARR